MKRIIIVAALTMFLALPALIPAGMPYACSGTACQRCVCECGYTRECRLDCQRLGCSN